MAKGYQIKTDLTDAMTKGDAVLAVESTSAMSHVGEALLRRHLGREAYEELTIMRKEIAKADEG